MLREFTIYVTETTVRPVIVYAETPAEAQRIAEENYQRSDVADVSFEADAPSRRQYV